MNYYIVLYSDNTMMPFSTKQASRDHQKDSKCYAIPVGTPIEKISFWYSQGCIEGTFVRIW